MFEALNEFFTKWEGLWLFVVLVAGLAIELHSNYMLRKEYDYDKAKDDRRIRRKTTKKITKSVDGSVTEEQSEETSSPNGETK